MTSLAIQFGVPSPNVRELRRADFHDRYVIGKHEVYGLGSSLNVVGGKNTTTLVRMHGAAATMIRAGAENLCESAEVIARTEPPDEADDGTENGD